MTMGARLAAGLLASAGVFVAPLASAPSAAPQEMATSRGGAIPVSVVDGRLVVACDLSTPANRIPVNLFLEVEGRHGLQLHNRAAASLRAESSDGQKRPITIHFPEFEITVPGRELGDEDLFEEFTKYQSAEIGENALVGSIGVDVLKEWTVTFEVGAGRVMLERPETAAGAPPTSTAVRRDGTIVAPLKLIDDMVWLPVRWGDGSPAGLMLGCGRYDTLVDRRAASSRGRPAGDVGPVRLGSLDLSRHVAFRPEPVVQVHPDGVFGVTGIGLLEDLRLRIDRARGTLEVRATREPTFPEDDLMFFRARADEDPDSLLAFLDAHGGRPAEEGAEPTTPARLAHEAARLLLDYRLEDGASREESEDAVQWIFDTMKGDLRTTRMLDLMKEMADAGEDDVGLAGGRLGVEAGRDDRYPNAVHEVHGRMGRTLLDRSERSVNAADGASDEAWRHLLSAAFGLPEDGRINYDLGRFYEGQGRYRRAFSRYVQAVIKPEAGGLAIDALQRVQPLIAAGGADDEGTFSVETIEQMIAGKVRNFGASSRFVASEEQPCNRVVLTEFFTNGHFGDEARGGAIGGALGFEGLISHFGPGEMAFLEYHLPKPQPDSLCSSIAKARAGDLGIDDPQIIVLDGAQGSPGAGKWRDAEEIYSRARRVALERMREFGDFEIDIEARLEDGGVFGAVSLYGPDEDNLGLQVVLAEKGVLYPGGSGVVVHRYVARASMIGDDLGKSVGLDEDDVEIEFGATFAEVEEQQLAFLDQLEADGVGTAPRISTRMDPNQARVIAFLFDERSGRVLAAASAIPDGVVSEDGEVEIPETTGEDR